MPRSFSADQRRRAKRALFIREGGRCFYCDRTVRLIGANPSGRRMPRDAATLDHIEPVVEGGRNAQSNLVLACFACNTARGLMPAAAFLMRTARPSLPPTKNTGGDVG